MYHDAKTTTVTAYDVLGIDFNADQKDVHAALRKLALAWHPDRVPNWRRGEATLRFQAIMDAYNNIRTPDARKAYDETIKNMGRGVHKRLVTTNDNLPMGTKARAWLRALETVFWPVRK